MAKITPQLVKELRENTGAGMADCKKALVETDGDMKQAVEFLRKKGAASAAKRSDKAAKEGMVVASTDDNGKKGIMVEINCETDFVAKNDEFVKYANTVAGTLLKNKLQDVDALMKAEVAGDTIEGIHNEILAKFSENIMIRRFIQLETRGYIESYIHAGNKLGVLVEVTSDKLNDEAKSLVRDIAMQIAAMNPDFVNRDEVDQTTLEKEKDIYYKQAIDSGKKEEIADRIANGRMEKFFSENCLVEQVFVKDSKKTVKDVLKDISKLAGEEVDVTKFVRFSLGEEEDNE